MIDTPRVSTLSSSNVIDGHSKTRAWFMPLMLLALSQALILLLAGCGSSEPENRHTGDRIANPTRIQPGQHVRILEVGEGDAQYDTAQSFKGVICQVGSKGAESGWSDGLFKGELEHCSNGNKRYVFQYVKLEIIPQP